MSKFFIWFVIMSAVCFFLFVIPNWAESSKLERQKKLDAAPVNGPAPKAVKTEFGEIKRARLEGYEKDGVELVEYPNGLVCVKYRLEGLRARGAAIDCDWSKYNEK